MKISQWVLCSVICIVFLSISQTDCKKKKNKKSQTTINSSLIRTSIRSWDQEKNLVWLQYKKISCNQSHRIKQKHKSKSQIHSSLQKLSQQLEIKIKSKSLKLQFRVFHFGKDFLPQLLSSKIAKETLSPDIKNHILETFQVFSDSQGKILCSFQPKKFPSFSYHIIGPNQQEYGNIQYGWQNFNDSWKISLNKNNKLSEVAVSFFPVVQQLTKANRGGGSIQIQKKVTNKPKNNFKSKKKQGISKDDLISPIIKQLMKMKSQKGVKKARKR